MTGRTPAGLVSAVVARTLENRREELKTLERDTARFETVKVPFPRLQYDDAIELIGRSGRVDWLTIAAPRA